MSTVEFSANLRVPQTAVVVTTSDGTIYRDTNDSSIPPIDLLAQGDKLANKFRALSMPCIGTATAELVVRDVLRLGQVANVGHFARGFARAP